MAAEAILFDDQSDIGKQIVRYLQLIREGREGLRTVREILIKMKDLELADEEQYALIVTEVGYESAGYATAKDAAKRSFEELDSLFLKLVATSSDATGTAIDQCAALHGV